MGIKDIIVYEDKNLLVINKPRHLLTISDNSNLLSLDQLVWEYLKFIKSKNAFVPSPINRLDKDTSGLVLFAKNRKTMTYFSSIFAEHQRVNKFYLVLVNGEVKENGVIEAPIRKNFQLKKMVVAPVKSGGKEAKTIYTPIKNFKDYTLLSVQLLTGRTHQIRVHMSYIRHHVVGDNKYGDFKTNNIFKKEFNFEGQFLHAEKIVFDKLEEEFSYLSYKQFVAHFGKDEQDILDKLI